MPLFTNSRSEPIFQRPGIYEAPPGDLVRYMSLEHAKHKYGGTPFAFPYTTEEVKVADVFDLRRVETQAWLLGQMEQGAPPICYDYFDKGKVTTNLILDFNDPPGRDRPEVAIKDEALPACIRSKAKYCARRENIVSIRSEISLGSCPISCVITMAAAR
jgi:hypothetical protein